VKLTEHETILFIFTKVSLRAHLFSAAPGERFCSEDKLLFFEEIKGAEQEKSCKFVHRERLSLSCAA